MNKFPPYKGTIKLNLGCGDQKIDGYKGVDIRDCGQEIIWDVRNGIPFPDNSVDEVFSCHFIEHMTDAESMDLLREIYRVLKPKGATTHRCPHQAHPTAYYWGHNSFWNEAKIEATVRVSGLEKMLVTRNERVGSELFFSLSKIK